MEEKFTDADISNFLKGLLELGDINTVDDSPDKYIRTKSGDQEMLSVDGVKKPLAIYGTRAEDAIIINPLAEGESGAERNAWFYGNRNMVLAAMIKTIIAKALAVGAASHARKKTDKDDFDPLVSKLIADCVLEIDEKVTKEWEMITKDLSKFFSVFYNKTTKNGQVSCLVFNEVQRKPFRTIRAKSWKIFEKVLTTLLGTSNLEEFNYTPKSFGAPVFESIAAILVKIYKRINPFMKLVERDHTKSLTDLEGHIKYIPQYYAKAKWCTSVTTAAPVPAQAAPAAPILPGTIAPWATGPVSALSPVTSMSAAFSPILQPATVAAPMMAAPMMPALAPATALVAPIAPVVPSMMTGVVPATVTPQLGVPQQSTAAVNYGTTANNPFARP